MKPSRTSSLRIEPRGVKSDVIPTLWEEMVVCPHRVYNRKSRRVSHNGWRLVSIINYNMAGNEFGTSGKLRVALSGRNSARSYN